ncbi:hypothetical protein EYC84_004555 [Monilinia fructicola]|uniref:Uncharacterized protein n=1 Tax=Monilinia fructicola TaxID=38448 RepID=A0A5M9K5F5_MONFR|nr:hypothetical protein EYC84_004555 [Monilinia fructicola]
MPTDAVALTGYTTYPILPQTLIQLVKDIVDSNHNSVPAKHHGSKHCHFMPFDATLIYTHALIHSLSPVS